MLCRQSCVLPDFTGLLCDSRPHRRRTTGSVVAPKCPPNATYFSTLQQCVSTSISSLPAFSVSIQLQLPCAGGAISTPAQLESLRFCTSITGSLVITVSQPADYSALHDIASIGGLGRLHCSAAGQLTRRRAGGCEQQHDDAGRVCPLERHQHKRQHLRRQQHRLCRRCDGSESAPKHASLTTATGNANLTDVGTLLLIQLPAAGSTYIAGNSEQCIAAPSVTWSQRNDSYLSYNAAQVCCAFGCSQPHLIVRITMD